MARVTAEIACRSLERSDLPAVMEIEEASFAQPWSAALFAEEIGQSSRRYLAAETDGVVRGFGGILVMGEEATIVTLAVQPGWRERGVATCLLLGLVDAAREAGVRHLTLEVRESNAAALDLYRKFGFEPAGVRKGYYTTEDAVIMWAVDIDSAEYGQRIDSLRGVAS